jgi:hypothetical protein
MRPLKRDLEKKADNLRLRLENEEVQRSDLRMAGRQALELADSILQGVEQSLANDGHVPLSAREPPRRINPLPPIVRPDTAEQ